jgi:transposase
MVKRRMYRKIQKLKNRGYGKSKIAKMLEMDPATVRKYYSMDLKSYNRYRLKMEERKKIFEDFREEIIEVYRENNFRKLNMSAVYDYLEEKFSKLPGNEQTLRNYIGYLINSGQLRLDSGNRCYSKVAPLPYGKQLQIDFGEYRTRSGLKLYIFGAVLSASRYKYIAMQGVPFTTLDLIGHVLDCFDYLGEYPGSW